MNRILEKITLLGIFIIPIVPTIITDYLFFPYISGKNFFFRIVVEVIFAAWLIWAVREPSVRPQKSSLLIFAGLFVFFMIMSGVFGESPSKSFWSNFERMEGIVGYLHVFMFMFVAACTLSKERFKNFFQVNLGVGTMVAIYGLLQHFDVFAISQEGVRVDGTLGNPIYMAAYMLLCFFLAILFLPNDREEQSLSSARTTFLISINVVLVYLLFIIGKVPPNNLGFLYTVIVCVGIIDILFLLFRKNIKSNALIYSRVIYGVMAFLFLAGLYVTQTRGAIVGLVAGLLFTGLVLAIQAKGRGRKFAIGGLVAVVLLCGLFWLARDSEFVKNQSTLNRLASISLTNSTTASRVTIWGMALEGFKEHSVLGWGNENFNLIFNKYYQPKLITSEQWFDRSHNILLDWLTQTGLTGFLLYILLFASAFYYLFRKGNNFSINEKALIAGLLVAYFIQNLFVFDNISSLMIFAAVLGYIYRKNSVTISQTPLAIRKEVVNVMGAVVLVAVFVSLYYLNIRPIKVAFALNQGTILSTTGMHEEALNKYKYAISKNTLGVREAREQLMIASQRALFDKKTSPELNQLFLDETAREMQKQLEEFPGDLRNYVLLGSYLKIYGLFDQAILFLEEAKKLSPDKQVVYHMLADIYMTKGDSPRAIIEAKAAYDLYPESEESAKILAIIHMLAGDQQFANDVLTKTFGHIYAYDPRLMNIYVNQKDEERVIGVWMQYTKDNPKELLGYMNLYNIFIESGGKEKALEYLLLATSVREEMVKNDARNVEKIIGLSDLYVKGGRLDLARTQIESAIVITEKHISRGEDDYRAYMSLASFYLVVGRQEESITILQKALKIQGAPTAEINNYISVIASGKNPWAAP